MRWIRGRAFPVPEPAGPITRVVGVAEDITEAQRQLEDIQLAEAALRSSEERWRLVFENSAIGIVLADPSGQFVEANRAFQELVGYTNQELKTLTYVDITHEADIPRGAEAIQQLLSGTKREVQLEKRYRHKDGRFIWVRATGTVDSRQRPVAPVPARAGRRRDRPQDRRAGAGRTRSASCTRSPAD